MSNPSASDAETESLRTHSQLWPDVSLLGVALIWGINIPVMKNGLDQVDVYVFNGIRLTFSALVLAAFAWRERRRRRRPPIGISGRQLLIYALVVAAVYQVCFLLGVNATTSGNTALIFATVPMWTALMARLFIGEKLQRIAWCGLSIALLGTIKQDPGVRQFLLRSLERVKTAWLWLMTAFNLRRLISLHVGRALLPDVFGAV